MKKRDVFDIKLDSEEQEIADAIEAGKLKKDPNFKKELALAKQAAANYLRKDARVNIRISSSDLSRLKQKAAFKGLPYQTFIASILHEFAAGHFKGF
jgi:predicted DNA binding CopG/RHH family protein